ncbi:MAG: hypothetical protein IKN04_13645 [Clostridia bacterium]|nr:hypothetical protein [Clostridia bacterium]
MINRIDRFLPFFWMPAAFPFGSGRTRHGFAVRSSLSFWMPAAFPFGSGRTRHGFARALILIPLDACRFSIRKRQDTPRLCRAFIPILSDACRFNRARILLTIAMYFHGSQMANELHIMPFCITISMRIILSQRRITHETIFLHHYCAFCADAQRGHSGKRLSTELHLLPGQMGLRMLLPMHGAQSAVAESSSIMLRSRVHASAFRI